MSGYVPLFQSLTTGTLCGRWPDVGLWPIVLSLTDRHGVVDMTPAYIARVTGLDQSDVVACMRRFCEPDADSRSGAEGGARLVLIDAEHRDWGWRVVNHSKYREKARKAAYDSERTASGADQERKRREREVANGVEQAAPRDNPTRPDVSRALPLSDSDSDKTKTQDLPPRARPVPASFHDEVVAAYHELLPENPRVREWTVKRRQLLDRRIAERMAAGKPANTLHYWREFFQKVATSDLLCGRVKNWRANLQWLISRKGDRDNFLEVIEGAYDNGRSNGVDSHG
jgi:hypothetical protein